MKPPRITTPPGSTIGVIGLGLMGSAAAARLTSAGFTVVGYDVDAGAAVDVRRVLVREEEGFHGGIRARGWFSIGPPAGAIPTRCAPRASVALT